MKQISDAEFKKAVNASKLSDKEIARACGASTPTVSRWRSGRNAPHLAMRKHVLRLL